MPSNGMRGLWAVLLSWRLWLAGLMGFASGLPLLLTLTLLQAWLTDEGVSLTTIGLLGLVGLPYNIKFLWAPLVDRFKPLPLGRRRGWLLLTQICLAGSIALLGIQSPGENIWAVVLAAYLVTFFSASQDIVVDAYRRESLADVEQGLAASFYTYGYRLGMLLAAAGGLILSDHIGFEGVYFVMALVMLACVGITLVAPEPEEGGSRPRSIKESFVGPFVEFLTRGNDIKKALLVLVFILIYKLGDNMAQAMTIPYYLSLEFTRTEIGAVAKIFGTAALLAGVFVGGAITLKLGLLRSLLVIGILQGISTAGFAVLAYVGHDLGWLAAVIAFENLTGGMGTAALLAFMAALTNKQFTATQFALLSALATLPRVVLVAPSGLFATLLGWPQFFMSCAIVAVPGLMLLVWLRRSFDLRGAPVAASASESAVAAASD